MKRILLLAAFVSLLFSPAAALGQTPPPAQPTHDPYSYSYAPAPRCGWWEFWCSESVYRNPNLSPNTKRKLYEHDPNVCHCDECRRMRLAAGAEYQGYQPYRVQPPRRSTPVLPPPPVYTPAAPTRRFPMTDPDRYVPLVWCSSIGNIVPATKCPDKK